MDPHTILEHIPRLRRYARALAGDRYAADDLVQDTLERACRKLHLWRPGSDMRAWLFSIMHNVFVDDTRRPARELERTTEEPPTVATRATQGDMMELADMDRALAQLPPEQREVLLLIAIEQLSYQEASRALAIPIGTVMSRLSRGRERLRQILGGMPAPVSLKVVK